MYKHFLSQFKIKIAAASNSFQWEWQVAIPIQTVIPVPQFEEHLSIFNRLPANEPIYLKKLAVLGI
jgi:hypothetical protein